MSFDVEAIREQFPILGREVNGKPLVYLDNAATTQKPQCMIDALVEYYAGYNSNVHRGAHQLADEATQALENARDTVARFVHASYREEIIWTSGTTDAINLVANGMHSLLKPEQNIVVTEMEHHADLVTWQQACHAANAELRVAPINEQGELDIDAFSALIDSNTALVAFPHVSNALGTLNPIALLTQIAKEKGALVLIDGAQGIAHERVDLSNLGCDFYAFSAHKLFGPTGMGVLWGRKDVLESWPVWKTGGEMIERVTYQDATWQALPFRFEAGTPNIAGAIAMAAAVEWFSDLDWDAVHQYETELLAYASESLSSVEGIRLIGTAADKAGVVSFLLEGAHPSDVGFMLDKKGIAIRAGDHCAQPLMNRLGIPGTARASFSIYNTREEVDALVSALRSIAPMFA